MTAPPADLPVRSFPSRSAWDRWLGGNHDRAPGVWLKIAKKGSGVASVAFADALDVALCYGWIDGQRRALDGTFYVQRFTPRRPKSTWSKVNRARAVELIEEGKMTPAGLREVERAKADGRWDAAYDSPANMTVPDDLAGALAKNKRAQAFFETLDSRNRYAVLYRVHDAKRPETRTRRIEQFVAMLARHEKPYP